MSEYFTDEELQAIVEGARARSGWAISHDNPKYRKGCSSIYDSATNTPKVSFGGASTETAQFILDAIQALPILSERVATLQAQNAALQARIAEMVEYTGAWEDFTKSGMSLGEWLDRRP